MILQLITLILIINRNHKMFPKGWKDKVDIIEN